MSYKESYCMGKRAGVNCVNVETKVVNEIMHG